MEPRKKTEDESKTRSSSKVQSAKRDLGKLYNWDPRPLQYRSVNKELTNNFVRKLQEINEGQPYMWETILRIQYDDFTLDDDEKLLLLKQCDDFENSIRENCTRLCGGSNAVQVPGTEQQRDSGIWVQSRWPIITASDSKIVGGFVICRVAIFAKKLEKVEKIFIFLMILY